jgi:hypothetical protein
MLQSSVTLFSGSHADNDQTLLAMRDTDAAKEWTTTPAFGKHRHVVTLLSLIIFPQYLRRHLYLIYTLLGTFHTLSIFFDACLAGEFYMIRSVTSDSHEHLPYIPFLSTTFALLATRNFHTAKLTSQLRKHLKNPKDDEEEAEEEAKTAAEPKKKKAKRS